MHFYNEKGEPRHFVEMQSRRGELRPTRLADARKAGWYPSVTTIQNLLDKPALTNWKIDEHLKQAYGFNLFAGTYGQVPLEQFIEEVKNRTQTALDKAPKDGTDFHDELEKWFTGAEIEHFASVESYAMCEKTDDVIIAETNEHDWITEKSFVHSMGYAGKVDLHCVGWVLDHKTKNTKDKWKPGKMAYPEMAMQLAAYRVGLGLDNARCANVFICLEDGAVEFHEWPEEELSKQWANFADLLRIWLRNAGYIPGSKPTENS